MRVSIDARPRRQLKPALICRRKEARKTGTYGGGNVSCNAGGNSYSWDSRNRLTSLVSPSVGTWSYGYDPLGRRQVNAGPSLTGTSYLYDGWNVARESSVAGTTTANLLNGPGLDERYIRGEISGSTTTSVAYLTDALGSTVALAKNGAAQTFYGYDPFGVQATPTGVADGNPFAAGVRGQSDMNLPPVLPHAGTPSLLLQSSTRDRRFTNIGSGCRYTAAAGAIGATIFTVCVTVGLALQSGEPSDILRGVLVSPVILPHSRLPKI